MSNQLYKIAETETKMVKMPHLITENHLHTKMDFFSVNNVKQRYMYKYQINVKLYPYIFGFHEILEYKLFDSSIYCTYKTLGREPTRSVGI